MGFKPTVIFDFDGVIHSYTSGWKGVDIIPDPPVPEVNDVIFRLRKDGWKVVVVSSRCAEPKGIDAIKQYLYDNNIEVDDVLKEKPPALVCIDDRAITFDGKNVDKLYKLIRNFQPWNKIDPPVYIPEPGEEYEHYRTNHRYIVLGVSTHTETGEKTVVYQDSEGKVFNRPISMFAGHVKVGDTYVNRFYYTGQGEVQVTF